MQLTEPTQGIELTVSNMQVTYLNSIVMPDDAESSSDSEDDQGSSGDDATGSEGNV